jgi:hypothetical protein
MIMPNYKRDITDLKSKAVMWWPAGLRDKNTLTNILPLLLKSQDDFLRILMLSKEDPFNVFELISAAKFPGNLFLKHLAVLSDYGGEPIQRLGRSFSDIFPRDNGGFYFEFIWNNDSYRYNFKALPVKGLNSQRLSIDGGGLIQEVRLNDLLMDMIAIMLFSSTSKVSGQAGLDVCGIGTMLGDEVEITKFVKQRYIIVSKQTSGATANSLGQLAQSEIVNTLIQELGDDFRVIRNGTIDVDGYEKEDGMPFDIVVEKGNNKVGIEVSFQVTTNSTIERKAGQAAERQNLMHQSGYHIAYVLDGAGNFQRSSAISTICNYSDCTVAYSPDEFKILATWIKSVL